jgi:hypothetical protein
VEAVDYYVRQGEVTKTVRTVMASTADVRIYVYGMTVGTVMFLSHVDYSLSFYEEMLY